MNPHALPPLPPLGQAPAPGTTHTNPGLVDVASQCYPAVQAAADQTQLRGGVPSGSLVNSSGEEQHKVDLDTIGSKGISVSPASSPLVNLSGDSCQRIDKRPPDTAVSTGTGLPAEVHADFASHVASGLPQNVMIR